MDTFLNIIGQLMNFLRAADLLPDFVSARGVFCFIAWLATFLALISLIISFFANFDNGGDADVPGDSPDGDTGAFSLRAIVGFLLGLGWGGYIAMQNGFSVLVSTFAGLLLGAVLFIIIVTMMRFIYSLKSDGTLRYEELVGLHGTVYVTIPPHGEPGGQVQVAHPSQLVTMPAVQTGSTPLPSQSSIVVTHATSSLLTVQATDPSKN